MCDLAALRTVRFGTPSYVIESTPRPLPEKALLLLPPGFHALKDRDELSSRLGEAVLNTPIASHLHLPADNAVLLELPELLDEDLMRDAGNGGVQLIEPPTRVREEAQDRGFPLLTHDPNRKLQGG
jgi:hypothetical protein